MIIGVSSKARSGKDEFFKAISEIFEVEHLSFANTLKKEVINFLDSYSIIYENRHLYGENIDKEESLYITKDVFYFIVDEFKEFALFKKFMTEEEYVFRFTMRSLLQFWGTEYRRAQDDNYWVNATLKDLDESKIYILTDCRFKNEAIGIKNLGGIIIRIERPDRPYISNENHLSEIDLDDYTEFNYLIINDGTLEEYKQKCLNVFYSYLGDCQNA